MASRFLTWWLGQLADLLPQRWRRSVLTAIDALIIAPGGVLDGGSDSVVIGLRRHGKEMPLGRFGLNALALRALPQTAGRLAVLRLPQADMLTKTIVLPIAAERDLNQVLSFEMDRETPFKADELYWNHRIEAIDRQNGRLTVRLLLLPKDGLRPLLASLDEAGVLPRRVEIADGPDEGFYLPLDGTDGSLRHPYRRFVWPAAACCALLGLGAIVTPFVHQSLALAALDREIAVRQSAAPEVKRLRQEIDRLSGNADLVTTERGKTGRPLEVLAGATRIMPDDTYLTEMDLRQHKVTLSGRSAAAARLIGALAADSAFRNPAFAAPVTRLEALRAEVFTINAEVGP
jgi:general secretion pathway protein L